MEHGFTSVDRQPDPAAWVACLDTLRREPFYRGYKRRVLELVAMAGKGRYLDVGAGTGDDARELAAIVGADVIALDRSFRMSSVCRARGGVISVMGDAARLPFADNFFDGCLSDRTFQHLSDPRQALAEMVRVVRNGGRLCVADPDYDTQILEFPDQELARRVLRFRADRCLRNGALAHRMPALFREARIENVAVESRVLIVRDATSVVNVMGLRGWASLACEQGELARAEMEQWERMFDQTVQAGDFLYSVSFFLTSGSKPLG